MEKLPTIKEYLQLHFGNDFHDLSNVNPEYLEKKIKEYIILIKNNVLKAAWSVEFNSFEEFMNCYPDDLIQ